MVYIYVISSRWHSFAHVMLKRKSPRTIFDDFQCSKFSSECVLFQVHKSFFAQQNFKLNNPMDENVWIALTNRIIVYAIYMQVYYYDSTIIAHLSYRYLHTENIKQ